MRAGSGDAVGPGMRTHQAVQRVVVIGFSVLLGTSGCVRHGWPTLKAGDAWAVVNADGRETAARVVQAQSAPFPVSFEGLRDGNTIEASSVRGLRKPFSVGSVIGGAFLGLIAGCLVGGLTGDAVGRSRPSSGRYSFPSLSRAIDVLSGVGSGSLLGLVVGAAAGSLFGMPVTWLVPEGSEPPTER